MGEILATAAWPWRGCYGSARSCAGPISRLSECRVDQAPVTIGLRKIAQHAAGERIELLCASLKRAPEKQYELMSRGFHWIQEMPYNR